MSDTERPKESAVHASEMAAEPVLDGLGQCVGDVGEVLEAQLGERYAVLGKIGEGGMATVYRAMDRELGRTVAIKVLPDQLAAESGFAERFKQEARTLAALEHGNIVRIYDFGEVGGYAYIVMELVDGRDLASLLAGNLLSPENLLEILIQVCSGLECAHERGVIHRDIKPGNILVDGAGVAKLADFGISVSNHQLPRLTVPGSVIGTPAYMAPEQRRGETVDRRADIFSLGVVLYEALTGQLPEGRWPAPSVVAGCDGRFDAVVGRCLEPEPGRRYATVGELKAALIDLGRGRVSGQLYLRTTALASLIPDRIEQRRIGVLMFTDIADSVERQAALGTDRYAALLRSHDNAFRAAVADVDGGRVIKHTGDGFLAVFSTASGAVSAALSFQAWMRSSQEHGDAAIRVRIGLHQGEIIEETTASSSPSAGTVGMAVNLAARVMGLAIPGQILLTRAVFDDARLYVREHPAGPGEHGSSLTWIACGRYLLKGIEEPLEIFSVGAENLAPSDIPPDGEKAVRSVSVEEAATLGWRPAAGLSIPRREAWNLLEKLGEGGFGEVWLAQQRKTKERRVFKFCFDADRLRSFKRELTLFRLIRDVLGKRDDIATLHEVQIERPPFYLESDYCDGGNLRQWADDQGGIEGVPLDTRLSILTQVCRAVGAAHSVGIIHRDLKPSNIFIDKESDGRPRPRLADFGIGVLADRSQLDNLDITVTGFTQSLVDQHDSTRTGTRLYAAPETLVGQAATVQGDIYALGVLLYQLVAGDLRRPLGAGWERDVEDPLLRGDIAECIDVDPQRRISSAYDLAERLESLPRRRAEKAEAERLARQAADAIRIRTHRRRLRRVVAGLSVLAACLAGLAVFGWMQKRTAESQARRAEVSEQKTKSQLATAAWSEINQADRLLDEANEADPTTGLGYDTYSKKSQEALLHLAKAIELDPSNAIAREKYGWILSTRLDAFPAADLNLVKRIDGLLLNSVAPNGRYAVIGRPLSNIEIVDLQSLASNALDIPSENVVKVDFCQNGSRALIVTCLPTADAGPTAAASGRRDSDNPEGWSDPAPKRARVIDSSSSKALCEFDISKGPLMAALTADGAHVAVADADGVCVRDASSAKVVAKEPSSGQVKRLIFSRDARKLLIVDEFKEGGNEVGGIVARQIHEYEDRLSVWNWEAGGHPLLLGGIYSNSPRLNEDGTVVAACRATEEIDLFDSDTGAIKGRIEARDRIMGFSKDGKLAVLENPPRVFAVPSGEMKGTFDGTILRLSPDGRRLATEKDGVVSVYDVEQGLLITSLKHPAEVFGAYFMAGGSRVCTVASDRRLRVWDLLSGRMLSIFKTANYSIRFSASMAFEQRIVVSSPTGMDVFEDSSPVFRHTFRSQSADLRPNTAEILTAFGDSADLRDIASGRRVAHIDHGNRVFAVSLSGDGSRVKTAGAGSVRVWEIPSGKLLLDVPKAKSAYQVGSSFLTMDGRRLIVIGEDKQTVSTFDIDTGGQSVRHFTGDALVGSNSGAGALEFSQYLRCNPDGSCLVLDIHGAFSNQGTTLLNPLNGAIINRWKGWRSIGGSEKAMFIRPSGSAEKVPRAVDLLTGEELKPPPIEAVNAVFSPDGSSAFLANHSTCGIYDFRIGYFNAWPKWTAALAMVEGHFSADGARLVTIQRGAREHARIATVWNCAAGCDVCSFQTCNGALRATMDGGNRWLMLCSDDIAEVIDVATPCRLAGRGVCRASAFNRLATRLVGLSLSETGEISPAQKIAKEPAGDDEPGVAEIESTIEAFNRWLDEPVDCRGVGPSGSAGRKTVLDRLIDTCDIRSLVEAHKLAPNHPLAMIAHVLAATDRNGDSIEPDSATQRASVRNWTSGPFKNEVIGEAIGKLPEVRGVWLRAAGLFVEAGDMEHASRCLLKTLSLPLDQAGDEYEQDHLAEIGVRIGLQLLKQGRSRDEMNALFQPMIERLSKLQGRRLATDDMIRLYAVAGRPDKAFELMKPQLAASFDEVRRATGTGHEERKRLEALLMDQIESPLQKAGLVVEAQGLYDIIEKEIETEFQNQPSNWRWKWQLAWLHNRRAEILSEAKEDFAAALPLYERALEMRQEVQKLLPGDKYVAERVASSLAHIFRTKVVIGFEDNFKEVFDEAMDVALQQGELSEFVVRRYIDVVADQFRRHPHIGGATAVVEPWLERVRQKAEAAPEEQRSAAHLIVVRVAHIAALAAIGDQAWLKATAYAEIQRGAARRAGDAYWESIALETSGLAYGGAGDLAKAWESWQAACAQWSNARGNLPSIHQSFAKRHLADIAHRQRRLGAEIKLLRDAVALAKESVGGSRDFPIGLRHQALAEAALAKVLHEVGLDDEVGTMAAAAEVHWREYVDGIDSLAPSERRLDEGQKAWMDKTLKGIRVEMEGGKPAPDESPEDNGLQLLRVTDRNVLFRKSEHC